MDELYTATTPEIKGRILVVDDNPILTESLRQALQRKFDVTVVNSGEACLELLGGNTPVPDLILLDIEMGGIDGFETCQRLRTHHGMPVIFVSSHDDLGERLRAFDSGGDDYVLKPFDPEVLLRKVERSVEQHLARQSLAAEKTSMQSMAMGFLRNIGDTGVLLNFMRSSLGLFDYDILAKRLLEATTDYGINCIVQIRHAGGCCTMTPQGPGTPLEESVLQKSACMGRIFQFSRRLVVNYQYVSVLITNLPDDESETGKLRDNIAILSESAEAIAETIAVRRVSAIRADALTVAAKETAAAVEALRELHRNQQRDARLRLQEMIDRVESAYVNLGLSENQEGRVSNILRKGADDVLVLFDANVEFEERFDQILTSLRSEEGKG